MNSKKILQIGIRAIFPVLAIVTAISELFIEHELEDQMDDIVYLGLAVVALVWTFISKNKLPKFSPIIFLFLGLATKIVSLIIEGDDLKAVDPDYAIIIFIVLGAAINMYYNFRQKKKKVNRN